MPRENRKRGKKHKVVAGGKPLAQQQRDSSDQEPYTSNDRPAWIVSAPAQEDVSTEAPFGYVDADVKAYFRNVDVQMKGWQENDDGDATDYGEEADPSEKRRMFFLAALREMAEKEKILATDPDCSVILERMTYSMDDFVRRVFMDKLSGSYEVLIKHRFASHVCQTLFSVVADTISRECQGISPTLPEGTEDGELRTVTQLVLDICEELLPTFTSLMMDPFASHVLRAIFLLLSPSTFTSQQHSILRSRKSAAWKAKQGPLKSVFTGENDNASRAATKHIPREFRMTARRFVEVVRAELSENEVRALAANKVASPVLQMLLEVEADQDMCDEPESLMDRVLVGTISACQNGLPDHTEPSDYLNTLLRDPTSSHLLETLVSRSPDLAFRVLWANYFQGKLARLAVHPVANFVVAKAFERLDPQQLFGACSELSGVWTRIIRASRVGVLRSLIDRASSLNCLGQDVEEAVFTAFELATAEQKKLLVSCAVCLLPISDYEEALKNDKIEKQSHSHDKRSHQTIGPLEPKVQGALLLQSLLQLQEPHNRPVLDSLFSISTDACIRLAHHPASSRVLDAVLESASVPFKDKRRFVMSFMGHYHQLIDDRIGSRVGDRCWAFADTYLKEKIARSLIPHESFLSASYYGKFFVRNLNLYLLQRKPDEWKTLQSEKRRGLLPRQDPSKTAMASSVSSSQGPQNDPGSSDAENQEARNLTTGGRKGKRIRNEDEIDALFNAKLGKKIKRGALDGEDRSLTKPSTAKAEGKEIVRDPLLAGVLSAIRSAPKDDKKRQKKKAS